MRSTGPWVTVGIIALITALFCAAYVLSSTPAAENLPNPPSNFAANGHTFEISYIATNQSSWDSGLMSKKITNSTTMLFVFPSFGTHAIWMSHVNSSLDVIWLNVTGDSGLVVSLLENVPPCSSDSVCPDYQSSAEANWMLETWGGFTQTYGIDIGTVVEFG